MDLCARLLDRNPETRIGSNGGAEEVRHHPWLADVNWEDVYNKQFLPPIDPRMNPDNFDPMFTEKRVSEQVLGIDSSGIQNGPQSMIENSNKLSQWSFAEGVDRSRDGSR
jgi:hypothetical protein